MKPEPDTTKIAPAGFIYPFVCVASLFALGGVANDLTNPLPGAFKEIFLISNAPSSLVQWSFHDGYATMVPREVDGLTPHDAKLCSAGLISAIVGGAALPDCKAE